MDSNRPSIKGLPANIDKDPDAIHMKLWKRKIYRKRVERNEKKKLNKKYFKEKQKLETSSGLIAPTEEAKELLDLDTKKQEFYRQLFAKTTNNDEEDKPDPKTKKRESFSKQGKTVPKNKTFNNEFERIKALKEEQLRKREEQNSAKLKKLKEKQRYARKMQQKTKTGQPVMKNLLSHYLTKL